MKNWKSGIKGIDLFWRVLGIFLIIVIWWILKRFCEVSDRVLPSISDVFDAIDDFEPNLILHTISTIQRLLIGFVFGVTFGIFLGLFIYKNIFLQRLFLPTIQAFRSIPPIATVPFFILWFGFSELGKYVMVFSGIAFNIAIASYQILSYVPEKYQIMFKSFDIKPQNLIFEYMLPKIFEELLPTIRFSLSTALGLVIVSELLGAQIGLGYLIQTSRSTYSMHVIFLVMFILGLISTVFDKLIVILWKNLIFWKK